MLQRWIVVGFGVIAAGYALAGAWGTGLLENDDAQDFLDIFLENPDARYADLVPNSLGVAYNDGYVAAQDGAFGIAAAEIIAAINGNPADDLPQEIIEWAKTQESPSELAFVRTRRSLDRVLNSEQSELAQLYAEDDALLAEFQSAIADLRSRLD